MFRLYLIAVSAEHVVLPIFSQCEITTRKDALRPWACSKIVTQQASDKRDEDHYIT